MAQEDPTLDYLFFKDVPEWADLPRTRREEVVLFLDKGQVPKDFIYHLLCNDFMSAMMNCPEEEVSSLPVWAQIIKEHVPMAAHGNKVLVESYARHRRDLLSGG